jgi:hypothetical protein
MALVLAVLSLLPMLVGFLTAGDFPQMLFKPPLWLVRVVYGSRYLLIALSLVLYFSAIIVHLLIAPTSIALLLVIGVLVLVLTFGAFFAEPTLLFPAIQQHPTWITSQQAGTELAPDDLVLVVNWVNIRTKVSVDSYVSEYSPKLFAGEGSDTISTL